MSLPLYEAAHMTRLEVAERVREKPMAILPIGATEQHGPHLPLATDTILAAEVARRLAEVTGALLFPAIPVSYSWVWRDIPGTLVIDESTVQTIIKEITHNLWRQGFRSMVLVNGHGANDGAMKYAVRELADELPEMQVVYFTHPGMNEFIAQHLESPTWHGMVHACESETSMMLAVHPELVHMDRAVREYPEKPLSYYTTALSLGAMSKSGVFGDATLGTAEKGRMLLDVIVERMAATIASLESASVK